MPASSLGIVIKIPREAVVPLLIGSAALLVLLFAGAALATWKRNKPAAARTFGLVTAVIFTGIALVFLARCLFNQSDPNNPGPGNLTFFDPPVAGFMAAVGTAFWRFGDRRQIALGVGLVIGIAMLVKPWVWPVIRTWTDHSYARGMTDPEHLVFLVAGFVVAVTGLIAGRKPIDRIPPATARSR